MLTDLQKLCGVRPHRTCGLLSALGLALFLSGCNKLALTKAGDPIAPESDSEFMLVQMQAVEQRQSQGLYDLIYSNKMGTQASDFRLAQGRFLMNDRGVFKYEQPKKDADRSFWIHYDPAADLVVGFPKLKTAYKAPTSILEDEDLIPVLAAYDAVRLILGLSETWSDPSKGTTRNKSGGSLGLEEAGRPYQWTLDFGVATGGGSPIASMVCQKGLSRVLSVARSTTTIPVASGTSGGKPMPDRPLVANQWEFVFGGSPGTTDLVLNAYPSNTVEPEKLAESFKAPELDATIQIKELTPALIRNWLNLR